VLPNYKRNPFSGGVKYTGWEKFANIAVYLENGTMAIGTDVQG